MILVDFNPVVIASIMAESKGEIANDISIIRHFTLNTLRSYRSKFKSEYGDLIICCDNSRYWRRESFPYYKVRRRDKREKNSKVDWKFVHESLSTIRSELEEFMPYPVIDVDGAEADDVIGVLSHKYGNTQEPILIIATDKDFLQLQEYENVKQWSAYHKKFLTTEDPEKLLREHIMKGDTDDDIPNFLSDDDTFVDANKRQKQLRQAKLNEYVEKEPEEIWKPNSPELRNYYRNSKLIDLSKIPEDIKDGIWNEFKHQLDKSKDKGRRLVINYFMSRGLRNLSESIGDF